MEPVDGRKALRSAGMEAAVSGMLETIKKIKRKIPFIQIPCEFISIYRNYGKDQAYDYAMQFRPRAVKKMVLEPMEEDILFSVVVPLYNTQEKYLREMIESVCDQVYGNWELCLVDASNDAKAEIEKICREYTGKDQRIRYIPVLENEGISRNTDYGIQQAKGSYIVLCDHDDILMPKALYMIADAIHTTNAPVYYTDEDHLNARGKHTMPLYKPDWSRDLLYSQMYTCHAFCFSKEIYEKAGGFRTEMDGAQDYDLMLRFSELTEDIRHIPFVLYSWRVCETSTAGNAEAKPYAHTAGLRALNSHLERRYGKGAYAQETEYPFVYRTRFPLPEKIPMVSIIIPMKDKWELTRQCIDSIRQKSTYPDYEIIILDNRSEEKETFQWFEDVQKKYKNVSVYKADFAFNWSHLNNYGMTFAKGDVYIFLNNDIEIISPDWMEILAENAVREDVGVVGPLLLYEDNTIQHAGIIVGMGGWADHVYKGMKVVHTGTPYISPLVSRNVTAVTGACMAVSRKTIERIGQFDEQFIICGSDVELCIRAYANGLNNLYTPYARLYHLESKSRDSYIPEIDFQMSYNCYTPFREMGDPYYNINLDRNRLVPRESRESMDYQKIKGQLKRNRLTASAYEKLRSAVKNVQPATYRIAETQPVQPRKLAGYTGKRLNLLVPSLNVEHVFGGIATALKFYKQLGDVLEIDLRVILMDAELKQDAMVDMAGFEVVSADKDVTNIPRQIVSFANRAGRTIPVGPQDIFMATGWWTAYTIFPVIRWQSETYGNPVQKLVYFIQDYEPGFYSWSSRYLMADSTYRSKTPVIAIFNSRLLYDFFVQNNYKFYREYYFEPVLNDALKKELEEKKDTCQRKKQILLYGRPGTERNAFELIVASLNKWCEKYPQSKEWEILSAGEKFDDISLQNGRKIHAVGKMSLEEYAQTMLESRIGISLMVSPHPSYPPLEMSTFGMKVITNCYSNKNLTDFNDNIVSLEDCSADSVADALADLCEDGGMANEPVMEGDYFNGENDWERIMQSIRKELL